jgi:DNA-binding response OmpR family regulator
MSRILVVDDEPQILRALEMSLRGAGYDVETATTGAQALTNAAVQPPDAVILDLVLPDTRGTEVCRELRTWTSVPVIVLSVVGDESEKVAALDAGADDYVTKPFDGAVLVARIRAVLRRFGHASGGDRTADSEAAPVGGGVLTFGDLEIDTEGMEVRRAGQPVALTPTEMRLLLEFSSAPGTVLSRDKLLERVWDYGWGGDTRVVDVHVQRLRTKIGQDRIETVRGFGYKLKA